MSQRSDIIGPEEWTANKKTGLIYSNVLGWIDLGHAQGNDIRKLREDILQGESGSKTHYQVHYDQRMYAFSKKVGAGKFIRWDIKKGLSLDEMHSIMLAMMLSCAQQFEEYQASRYFSWYTDSGYSGEDLPSDLLGFYRVVFPGDYKSRLKLINKNDALKRWDYYGPIGKYKNDGFLPLLFPEPDGSESIQKPSKGKLPTFMTLVHPYTDFDSGKVKVITKDGTFISFLSGRK